MGACLPQKQRCKKIAAELSPCKAYATVIDSKEDLTITHRTFRKAFAANIKCDYRFLGTLGEGACSKVFKALHVPSGQWRAVKRLKKTETVASFRSYLNEIRVLWTHPNFLRPFEYVEDDKHYYIVTEYCNCSILFDYIVKQQQSSCVNSRGTGVLQRYCSPDIKPENLLIHQVSLEQVVKLVTSAAVPKLDGTCLDCMARRIILHLKSFRANTLKSAIVELLFYILLTGKPRIAQSRNHNSRPHKNSASAAN